MRIKLNDLAPLGEFLTTDFTLHTVLSIAELPRVVFDVAYPESTLGEPCNFATNMNGPSAQGHRRGTLRNRVGSGGRISP
jgi:hypothetical protein